MPGFAFNRPENYTKGLRVEARVGAPRAVGAMDVDGLPSHRLRSVPGDEAQQGCLAEAEEDPRKEE